MNNKYISSGITIFCLLIAAISVSNALSEREQSNIENAMSSTLDEFEWFNYTSVEVDSDNTIKLWFMPNNMKPPHQLIMILGVYAGVCEVYPKLSDLNIFFGTKKFYAIQMYCKREWIDNIKNISTLEEKVLDTAVMNDEPN
jgi:hypothetical protein